MMTTWTCVARSLKNLRLANPSAVAGLAVQRPMSSQPEQPESDKLEMTSEPVTDNKLPISSHQETQELDTDKLYRKIELEVIAYEPSVLDSYQWFVLTSASHLGINAGKCWSPLKSDKDRFNLLKSAFVHKKHQVHYEFRAYHRFFTFHRLTGSTASTFLEYIERNLPEGCGLKVTKVEAQVLPKFLQKN